MLFLALLAWGLMVTPCQAQQSPGAKIRVSYFQRTNCVNGSCEVKPVANLCSATCVGLVRNRLLFVTAGHALWGTGKTPDIELELNGTWTPAQLELLGNQASGPDLAAVSVSGDVQWPMARLHTDRPAAGELVRINSILFGDANGRIDEGTLDGFTWATFDRQIQPGDSGSGVYDSQGLCGMLAWRKDVDPKQAWLIPPQERQRRWFHGRYIDGAVIAHWLHTHNLTPQLPQPRPFLRQEDEFVPRRDERPEPTPSPDPRHLTPPHEFPLFPPTPREEEETNPLPPVPSPAPRLPDPDPGPSPPPTQDDQSPTDDPSDRSRTGRLIGTLWSLLPVAVTAASGGGTLAIALGLFQWWRKRPRQQRSAPIPDSRPSTLNPQPSCPRCPTLEADLKQERMRIEQLTRDLAQLRSRAEMESKQFIPYETSHFKEAFDWAVAETTNRYPSTRGNLVALEHLMKQYLASKGIQ